jgi:cytochrome-b5 reductase
MVSGLRVSSIILLQAPVGEMGVDGKREMVTRPYSPISRPDVKGYVEFAIKKVRGGRLTSHIGKLTMGDTIDARGPVLKMFYEVNSFKEIGMVAGGSGITPMLQVADEILENPLDLTRISLVFCNTSEADVMLKHQLDDRVTRYPDQIKIHYIVDRVETGSNWKGGVGFVTPAVLTEHLPAPVASTKVCLRAFSR